MKAPQSITNVVLYLSSKAIDFLWYPEYPPKKEYASYPIIVFRTSSIKGNGIGSFFVVAFRFLKFVHIRSFPLFLGILTMGDNHVAFYIDWMNLTTNNLSISYLIVVA